MRLVKISPRILTALFYLSLAYEIGRSPTSRVATFANSIFGWDPLGVNYIIVIAFMAAFFALILFDPQGYKFVATTAPLFVFMVLHTVSVLTIYGSVPAGNFTLSVSILLLLFTVYDLNAAVDTLEAYVTKLKAEKDSVK